MKYYMDKDFKLIFAYERECEFFVRYNKDEKTWDDCSISFRSFVHDRNFVEIAEDEAMQKTDGISPETAYTTYLNILKENLS